MLFSALGLSVAVLGLLLLMAIFPGFALLPLPLLLLLPTNILWANLASGDGFFWLCVSVLSLYRARLTSVVGLNLSGPLPP